MASWPRTGSTAVGFRRRVATRRPHQLRPGSTQYRRPRHRAGRRSTAHCPAGRRPRGHRAGSCSTAVPRLASGSRLAQTAGQTRRCWWLVAARRRSQILSPARIARLPGAGLCQNSDSRVNLSDFWASSAAADDQCIGRRGRPGIGQLFRRRFSGRSSRIRRPQTHWRRPRTRPRRRARHRNVSQALHLAELNTEHFGDDLYLHGPLNSTNPALSLCSVMPTPRGHARTGLRLRGPSLACISPWLACLAGQSGSVTIAWPAHGS